MGEVVDLDVVTTLEYPPKKILKRALDEDLATVVVIGYTKDGEEYFSSSIPDSAEVTYMMERAKWNLFQEVDNMSK